MGHSFNCLLVMQGRCECIDGYLSHKQYFFAKLVILSQKLGLIFNYFVSLTQN